MSALPELRSFLPAFLVLLACAAGDDDDDGAGADTETTTASTTESSSSSDPDSTGGDPLAESSDTAEPGDDATSDESGESTTGTAGPPQLPPQGGAALLPWLESASYTAWSAESGPHPSAGPHGSGVRTFVNDALFASLDAGNGEHPQDAAVVKELFDGDGSLSGWAVMVKVAPGQGGASWYWYEIVGTSTYADGIDEGLCTGCHETGVDQVLTPFPLQ